MSQFPLSIHESNLDICWGAQRPHKCQNSTRKWTKSRNQLPLCRQRIGHLINHLMKPKIILRKLVDEVFNTDLSDYWDLDKL